MVEQLTLNQLVEGSSPSRSTTLFYKPLEVIEPKSGNESGNESGSVPDIVDSRRSDSALLKKISADPISQGVLTPGMNRTPSPHTMLLAELEPFD